MTELETIQHAKNYLDKMAQGINPLTNEPIPEGELLNNIRISRCLFYASGVLGKVIANGGIFPPSQSVLPSFSIDYRLLENYPYSEYPLGINQIVGRISDLVPPNTVKRLSYAPVSKWLIDHGYLTEVLGPTGKRSKRPTPKGLSAGITTEQRSNQSGEYTAVVYDQNAQRLIIEHLPEMLEE